MNKRRKKQWINALTSGRYEQGSGELCTPTNEGDQFCCLGVLTNLYCESKEGRENGAGWNIPKTVGKVNFRGKDSYLHPDVAKWAGFQQNEIMGFPKRSWGKDVVVNKNKDNQIRLSSLNDNGSTFEEIAAVIQENF